MHLTVCCPYCGRTGSLPDGYNHSSVKCPGCHNRFTIAESSNPQSGEPLSGRPGVVFAPPVESRGVPPETERQPAAGSRRPFWKDPVVFIGASIPTIILMTFFGYLHFQWSKEHLRQEIIRVKEQGDKYLAKRQNDHAFERYDSLLRWVGNSDPGDGQSRSALEIVRRTRDRLLPEVAAREERRRQAEAGKPPSPPQPKMVADYSVWNLDKTLRWDRHYLNCVALSPDGQTIAVGGGTAKTIEPLPDPVETGHVQMWDVSDGAAKLSLTDPDDLVDSVAFYPDGSSLVVGDRHKTKIVDVKTGSTKFILREGCEGPIAFNVQKKILATNGGSSFWDPVTGQKKPSFIDTYGFAVFSPDGKIAYVNS